MVRNVPLATEIAEWLRAHPGVEAKLSRLAHDRFIQVRFVPYEAC